MKKMLDAEEMMPKVLAFGVEETGVLLHYCMEHPISRDDLELFQKLAGLPGVSSDYREESAKRSWIIMLVISMGKTWTDT